MATWHQQRNPVPLWHTTKWTVVNDPPNGMTTVMRFDTHEEARAFAASEAGSYVLAPYKQEN